MKVSKKVKPTFSSKKNNKSKKNTKIKKKLTKDKPEIKIKNKPKDDKKYSKMSVDEFLENNSDIATDDEAVDDISEQLLPKDHEKPEQEAGSESDEEIILDEKSHKESLNKLKDIDPEFYKFLQENDRKLLNFNVSDSEGEDERSDREEEDQIHKPSEDLEIASDEDDFEPEDGSLRDGRNITLKLLKKWQQDVHTDKSSRTLHCLAKAFHAALVRVSADNVPRGSNEYRVDGSSVFNAVLQLCVLEFGPALRRYLKIAPGSKQQAHKCKKFVKVKTLLRGYFLDLLKLLGGVTSPNILNVLLKHLHGISLFIVSYSSICKKMLKRLIYLWGSAEESVRVIAFLCILRITTSQPQSYLDHTLKAMYITYVKNTKFISPNNLAEINFMRRSLVEIFSLDLNVSYRHIFMYIRQLAIQLRSAVMLHKKEHIQGVYNWQFISSLHLWACLLGATCDKKQLQMLIYPLIQIAVGTVKLIPTAQYLPLRFHIVEILTELARESRIFIPVLPILTESLNIVDFNKKHKKVSMKPLSFSCILRCSKSQMAENGFKDSVIDNFYGLMLEFLTCQSHSVAFPDISLLTTIQLRQFFKKCSVSNYTKKLRQLLEKIEQNNQFILTERKKMTCTLSDIKQVEAFEITLKNKGTPISIFYDSWKKISVQKKQKEITDNHILGDFNLPVLRKGQKPRDLNRNEGQVELFPSDSEDEDAEMPVEEEKPEKKRGKRGNKKQKVFEKVSKEIEGDVADVVEDTKASDW